MVGDIAKEILRLILEAGVEKVIPHIYSSIIDSSSGNTRVEAVKQLLDLTKKVLM